MVFWLLVDSTKQRNTLGVHVSIYGYHVFCYNVYIYILYIYMYILIYVYIHILFFIYIYISHTQIRISQMNFFVVGCFNRSDS